MNDEIDPILVGETDDIEIGSVESFEHEDITYACLLYTSPSPRDKRQSRMPSSA